MPKRPPLITTLAQTLRRVPGVLYMPYLLHKRIQPRYSVGVVGVVFNEQAEVLLVEHVFHARLPWGLPGGWTDRSEDPAAAVEREMREELGLTVDAHTVLLVECTQSNHLDIAFLCTAQGEIGDLSYELLSYQWYALDDLPPMFSFHYGAIHRGHQVIGD